MKPGIWWRKIFCGVMLALGLAAVAQAADSQTGPSDALSRKQRDALCTKCHDETETKPILSIYQTPHGAMGDQRTPGCQTCHGESKDHLAGATGGNDRRPRPDHVFGGKRTTAGYQPDSAQQQSETCLSCHKSGLRMRWPGSQHDSSDLACTSCHTNHIPKDPVLVKTEQPEVCFTCHREKRAEVNKISAHPVEAGKMSCSDCHNPHGAPGPKLLAQNTVTETCFQCHTDKRGPFLWEHQPATEDCANCHNPHGSNITPLLKSRPPLLCDECHDGPHASASPVGGSVGGIQGGGVAAGGAPSGNVTGRACMNCHVMVHGSNSPAGAFLHR